MARHPIEVITSVERWPRWSREDKERLVAACFEREAVISEIARAAGIHISQLFRWRKELCRIELGRGRRVRADRDIDSVVYLCLRRRHSGVKNVVIKVAANITCRPTRQPGCATPSSAPAPNSCSCHPIVPTLIPSKTHSRN